MSDIGDANEGTEAETPENMDAAHAEVAAAEAKSPSENAGDQPARPENMEAAHEQVAGAVAEAQWLNVGTQNVGPAPGQIVTIWGNAETMISTVGLSMFFTVTLDGVDLGYWTKVSGLGMSISTTDRGETAMNFFQHHLPAHLTYDKITLERPVSPNSIAIMSWISAYHMLPVPTTAQICCKVVHTDEIVMSWDMIGVTPVSYKGPNFDAASTSPAMEQLTIQHMGFL